MVTFRTRWLLPMLLLNLPKCFTLGRPAPPSTPHCYIPCDVNDCFGDVYCSWEHMQNSQIPTNYSLHWRSTHNNEEQGITRTSFSGLIHRDHFSDPAELFVWVQAKNQYGSAKSNMLIFNTTDIIKPPPPTFNDLSDDEAFEIHWDSICDQLKKFVGLCDVRYRTDADQTWIEKKGFYSTYTIENPENCTAYELQVRCACKTSLASNWTTSRRIPGVEMAPIGKLDIWMDCGISTKASDCFLTWKELPISQMCGVILGYELRISHGDKEELFNLSTTFPNNQLKCDEMQCHFDSIKPSIKNATSVSLSAYNVHGANAPSYLPKLVTGKGETRQVFYFEMNDENLTVSWDVPPVLSDSLKKYVVQYKQAASLPGQGFSWVKLNKSQTTAFIRGQFKKYTAYRISLFAISHGNVVHHLSSAIGYSQQGAPPEVLSFKVLSISTTDVILGWEPSSLSSQKGLVLYYQIGVNQKEKVYNVSGMALNESKAEMELQHLRPGQDYEVWIRAVTAVGPGNKTTLRFKTNHHENFDFRRVLGIVCSCFICLFVVICVLTRTKKISQLLSGCYCKKIPDPKNSLIFREAKCQSRDPMTWICSPSRESLPKIIMLEVVLIQPSLAKTKSAEQLNTPIAGEWSSSMECEEDRRENAVTEKHQRTEYKKMVDSDEERSWSSSEEEPCTSGYEKHFMPTAVDILGHS